MSVPSFQRRVGAWVEHAFGRLSAMNRRQRAGRMIEEAAELGQACGLSYGETLAVVGQVYTREKGEPAQEIGGLMVTLAALCEACELDMENCGDTEIARCWINVERIRQRQAHKITFPAEGPSLPHDAAIPLMLPAATWRKAAYMLQVVSIVRERQLAGTLAAWCERGDLNIPALEAERLESAQISDSFLKVLL